MTETKSPAYRRDFNYDFRRYKSKRTAGFLQCPVICKRYIMEHWHNKCRCVALFCLPSMYMWMTWHFARYLGTWESGTLSLTPEVFANKQQLLVNEKTQIGGLDTKRWIDKMPMPERFDTKYIDTSEDDIYFGMNDKLTEYGTDIITE